MFYNKIFIIIIIIRTVKRLEHFAAIRRPHGQLHYGEYSKHRFKGVEGGRKEEKKIIKIVCAYHATSVVTTVF